VDPAPDTKTNRPSGVTATPNGLPPTWNMARVAESWGTDAAAVVQPGRPGGLAVRGRAAANPDAADATAGRGCAVRQGCTAGPDAMLHALTATPAAIASPVASPRLMGRS
jgi:hypothetical protein